MSPLRDDKAPLTEYCDLFCGLYVTNRDIFTAAMTNFFADVAVKLSVFVAGVVGNVIDKFLSELTPPLLRGAKGKAQ